MAKIHIGTSGWSYKDWQGNFYPADIKNKDYLSFYSQRFDTVEIDSTFYGIPRKTTIENWYKSVPAKFKFAPKFPQDITHNSDLTGIDDILSTFLENVALLRDKLGPLLIQFPYSFKPDEMWDNFTRFLKKLPDDFNYVVEIRNRKWLGENFYDLLRQKGIGLALLEHPWMPRLSVVTSKILYLRFIGDRRTIPDDFSHVKIDRRENLEHWLETVRAFEKEVDDFYGYFNNHYSGHAPTSANDFRDILMKKSRSAAIKTRLK